MTFLWPAPVLGPNPRHPATPCGHPFASADPDGRMPHYLYTSSHGSTSYCFLGGNIAVFNNLLRPQSASPSPGIRKINLFGELQSFFGEKHDKLDYTILHTVLADKQIHAALQGSLDLPAQTTNCKLSNHWACGQNQSAHNKMQSKLLMFLVGEAGMGQDHCR